VLEVKPGGRMASRNGIGEGLGYEARIGTWCLMFREGVGDRH
jgi:hypothetical protein